MPASLDRLNFSSRVDEFSVQISCAEDPRFWLRLEPIAVPKITDFFLGEFPPETGAELLARCFKLIDNIGTDRLPRPWMEPIYSRRAPPLMIFSNLQSDETESHANSATAALASFKRKIVHSMCRKRRTHQRSSSCICSQVRLPGLKPPSS
jgi:hypothetical protein